MKNDGVTGRTFFLFILLNNDNIHIIFGNDDRN